MRQPVPRRLYRRRRNQRNKAREAMRTYGTKVEDCHWCGCVMIDWPPNSPPVPLCARTVDHVIPLGYGGTSSLANLVYACYGCNTDRSKMSIDAVIRMNEAKLLQSRKEVHESARSPTENEAK